MSQSAASDLTLSLRIYTADWLHSKSYRQRLFECILGSIYYVLFCICDEYYVVSLTRVTDVKY